MEMVSYAIYMLMGGSYLEEIGEMLIGKSYANERFRFLMGVTVMRGFFTVNQLFYKFSLKLVYMIKLMVF